MTDDGFNIGVLYKGGRKPYQPSIGKGTKRLADFEAEFTV
jgi:2-oxoglutarate ferredoxin oxidoreductase subunit beta